MSTPSSSMLESAPASMGRAEHQAYPKHHASTFISKLQLFLRQHHRAVFATLGFLTFVLILSSDLLYDSDLGPHSYSLRVNTLASRGVFAGAAHPGYFTNQDAIKPPHSFRFAAVTDLDQLSFVKDAKKQSYRSYLLPGTITYDENANRYSIQLEDTRELITKHNEAGRGAEFSELVIFQKRLLTFDDRTGDVFEILNNEAGTDSFVVPRFVITEGEGDTDKGMKWEWATVYRGELYMGSMGKEYTNSDGSIANRNNLWVSVVTPTGELRREDWTNKYNLVRKALGAEYPGYLIHEAIRWSPNLKKWVFMPRRISSEEYNDVLDEKRGSNKIVLVDEYFKTADVVEVDMKKYKGNGLHGFSSFAFVPNTNDHHAMALRSVEEDCAGDDLDVCKQQTFIVIFDVLTGEVLMDEYEVDQPRKYEGLEFVDIHKVPPTFS